MVQAALYLGDRTRYTVELHGRGELVAVEQNRDQLRTDPAKAPGAIVRLAWDHRFDQLLPVAGGSGADHGADADGSTSPRPGPDLPDEDPPEQLAPIQLSSTHEERDP